MNQKINAIQEIIEKLPIAHQYLLLYLLDLLGIFVTAREYTRMDIPCLSSVFAPVSFFTYLFDHQTAEIVLIKQIYFILGHFIASRRQIESQ